MEKSRDHVSSAPTQRPARPQSRTRTALAALALSGILAAGCDDDQPNRDNTAVASTEDATPAPTMTPLTSAQVEEMRHDALTARFAAEERDPLLSQTNALDRDLRSMNDHFSQIGEVLHSFDSYFSSEAYRIASRDRTGMLKGRSEAKDPYRFISLAGAFMSFSSAEGNVHQLQDERFRRCATAFFATEPNILVDRAGYTAYMDRHTNLAVAILGAQDDLLRVKEHVQALEALLANPNTRIPATSRSFYNDRVTFLKKVITDYTPVLNSWYELTHNHPRPDHIGR